MPHCTIEYSKELDKNNQIDALIKVVHQQLIDSNICDPKAIKTRAIPVGNYLIGSTQTNFIHTTVRLLEGRTDKIKKELSNNILNSLSKEYTFGNISVEIVDINKNSYSQN